MRTAKYFTATWCGPCKAFAPIFDKIAEKVEGASFFSINVDENKDLALGYSVKTIPTVVKFFNGKEVDRKVGSLSDVDLLNWVNSNLENES